MRQISLHTLSGQSKDFQLVEPKVSFQSLLQSQSTWKWHQEWNNLIFLHWKVPFEILKPLIPAGLTLDTFYGSCVVTLVAYTMNNIRHIYSPAIPGISDFHQINLRTYVIKDNKPGIFIFHIEAEKILPVFLAKIMSGLDYNKASMKRKQGILHSFSSKNDAKNFFFQACYHMDNDVAAYNVHTNWLLDRYYMYQSQNGSMYRFDIKREEWVVNKIQLKSLILNYKIGGHSLNRMPDFVHYSKGGKALVWKRKLLSRSESYFDALSLARNIFRNLLGLINAI